MIRWFIIVLLTCSMFAPSVLAGTFRDDFEDGNLDGWRQAHPVSPVLWKIVDGELECTRQDSISTILVIGEDDWSDYTIEYDFVLLEDLGLGDVDAIARHIDPFWSHVLIFGCGDFPGGPTVFVQAFPGDKTEQEPFGPLELNQWHHIKLEVEDADCSFWVNDEKMMEYKDETVENGSIGLGLANYTARFDNVEITGPDVPDVTPPTWKGQSIEPKCKITTTWAEIKSN